MDIDKRRVLAAILLLFCLSLALGLIALRGPWFGGGGGGGLARALRGALRGLSGPNPMGADAAPQALNELLRRQLAPAGPGASSVSASGSPAGMNFSSAGTPAPGGQSECAANPAACAQDGADKPTLESIRMKARVELESSSGFETLGDGAGTEGGNSDGGAGLSGKASRNAAQPEDVAKIFQNFIQKLRARAQAQSQSGARSRSSYSRRATDSSTKDDENRAAIIKGSEQSPLMASPSFRNLLKVGKETNYGVNLYQHGMADGAKDKSGKEFDGSLNTYAPIPIEKSQGTFGKETIRARSSAPDNGN